MRLDGWCQRCNVPVRFGLIDGIGVVLDIYPAAEGAYEVIRYSSPAELEHADASSELRYREHLCET